MTRDTFSSNQKIHLPQRISFHTSDILEFMGRDALEDKKVQSA